MKKVIAYLFCNLFILAFVSGSVLGEIVLTMDSNGTIGDSNTQSTVIENVKSQWLLVKSVKVNKSMNQQELIFIPEIEKIPEWFQNRDNKLDCVLEGLVKLHSIGETNHAPMLTITLKNKTGGFHSKYSTNIYDVDTIGSWQKLSANVDIPAVAQIEKVVIELGTDNSVPIDIEVLNLSLLSPSTSFESQNISQVFDEAEIEKSEKLKSNSGSRSDERRVKSFFEKNSSFEFSPIDVSPSSENDFSTPVAWFNGSIYTVDIEPPDGENNGINLKTVVRKWTLSEDGVWQWISNVVENRTLDDRYHTQASIAIDKNGYIHVAYNMHNMPWQYKVSKKPEDISEFDFLGDEISTDTLSLVKHQNETPFPNIGTAAIPGTQVTYPSFFKDRNEDLYVTYRFATRPAQSWKDRGFAGGVAKYNVLKKTWSPIGGVMTLTEDDATFSDVASSRSIMKVSPFAYYDQWSVYSIRLAFDNKNAMHVSWTWREGGAGTDCSDPSYAFSNNQSTFTKANRQKYNLSIAVTDAETSYPQSDSQKFYALTSISTDSMGNPYIILNPIGSSRALVHYDQNSKTWSEPEPTPWGATEIYIDDNDRQWAFSSGPNVFYRDKGTTKWQHPFSSEGFGWPKIVYIDEIDGFLIHTLSTKDRMKSRLFWVGRTVKP